MQTDVLVIGASGYLGQKITQLLGSRAIPTHYSTQKFSNSLRYHFYDNPRLPADVVGRTVVFAAAVEMNQSATKLEHAMRQLLTQVSSCRFIYTSSDAVFGGESGMYTEEMQPDPVNEYGRNLVLCEQLVQEMVADYCIIRPSYIFGFVNGQLDGRLSRTRASLLAGGECRAFEDYYKSPLSVHEVAEAVVQLTQSGYVGPIHVAGPRMSAYEFHRQAMAALAVDTSNLLPEPMPAATKLMPDTSLDSSKWWAMRGSQPMSIGDALQIEQ